MTKPKPKLTPADPKACQVEERSFMTLGPGHNRCGKPPAVIVAERVPNEKDGLCGEMSMCSHHLGVFSSRNDMRNYDVRSVPV